MGDTQGSQTVSTQLQRIAEQAAKYPDMIFNNLYHRINVDLLREAYRRTRKDSATGVDGITGMKYGRNLEENLQMLCNRLRDGSYKAPPVKRVWIDKENGKKRPIGMTTFEDKIVQRAVVMVLQEIYEVDFYDFSYAFRRGRGQHEAIQEVREKCMKENVRWIVSADISGLFDNIEHGHLREFIQQRVNDGGILRLIGKWLNAGVMEEGSINYPEKGTPQGGVISPLLSNIFLHYVLDEWFAEEVKPWAKGKCFLVRFADDFIIGCELERDAKGIMNSLPKRFERYGLSLHPDKTAMIQFEKPSGSSKGESGNGTFDFLGFTFYWERTRFGYWVIKRKTARKRLRRFMKGLWKWCRENRHDYMVEQYKTLSAKLRGYYQYYGIRSNYRAIAAVYEYTQKAWKYWLSRRSSKGGVSCEKFKKLLAIFKLPKPRIVHNI